MYQDEEKRSDAERRSDSDKGETVSVPESKPSQQQRMDEEQSPQQRLEVPPPKPTQRQTVLKNLGWHLPIRSVTPSQQQCMDEEKSSQQRLGLPRARESQRQTAEFADYAPRDYRFLNQPDTETGENNTTHSSSDEGPIIEQ